MDLEAPVVCILQKIPMTLIQLSTKRVQACFCVSNAISTVMPLVFQDKNQINLLVLTERAHN